MRFARQGAEVTGIDLSRRSIGYARHAAAEEDLTIDYEQGDYLEYVTSRRFDLITMIYCDYGALSGKQRHGLLRVLRRFLAAHGALVLDVDSLAHFATIKERRSYQFSPGNGF